MIILKGLSKQRSRGFTLVELLIVIAIIGILATLALVGLRAARAKAWEVQEKSDLRAIGRSLESYAMENGEKYPLINGTGYGPCEVLKNEDSSPTGKLIGFSPFPTPWTGGFYKYCPVDPDGYLVAATPPDDGGGDDVKVPCQTSTGLGSCTTNKIKDVITTIYKAPSPNLSFNGLRNTDGNTRTPVVNYSKIDCGTGSAITGEGAFSVSVWVKRDRETPSPFDPDSWITLALNDPPVGQDSIMPKDFIISQGQGMYGDYYIYFNKYDQVTLRTWGYGRDNDGVGRSHSGEGVDLTSGTKTISPTDKNWHHIVVIRNADGLTGQMWVDGVDKTTYVCPGTVCPLGVKYISLGGYQSLGSDFYKTVIGALSFRRDPQPPEPISPQKENTPYPFKGNIDEVRTYTKALTADEVKKIFTGNTTSALDKAIDNSQPTGLKAFWKFDENSGPSIADSSGNTFACTTNNVTWANN